MGHLEGITFIDSRGDGRYFISNGKDQTIKLWDIRKMSSSASWYAHFQSSNAHSVFKWCSWIPSFFHENLGHIFSKTTLISLCEYFGSSYFPSSWTLSI